MYYPQVYRGKTIFSEKLGASAIHKLLVNGRLQLTSLGLEGDEQREHFHGGPDRALCHYPMEHYLFWKRQLPELTELFSPPFFGENISTEGMTEENVHIGDIFQWGETLIQITQPRSPCYKLNLITGISDFAAMMQNNGCCGWLYRVISPGFVSTAEPIKLLSRNSDISVKEAISIAFHSPFDEEQYRYLMGAAGLSASWSLTMQKRLLLGRIEDFNRRLFGHQPKNNAKE
ncbi:6-hydroxyaminopurine reductase [Xenorhabdus szentirmaii]|uniref:Protein yiiM n=1 Tax=Xenorhabdus szentirmaii DSM 16338 TaxID=1427518 RepID=W1IZW5_9GAMM|nr:MULTISPECIES: 6-hydroxyaminopurine reductase [Xenorhabdus]MBD2781821.1 6-N-hydroxylaminopurine resistance protein [Xenorhabdus sp. 38]PHM34490.1 6-N-hydroxylaminopurine resistance protein [Xenorhabdus szentirmaii DSM 16338]CDL82760.1 Protein yiiM [Xenorhabdus szentirmaii DSM 16338]